MKNLRFLLPLLLLATLPEPAAAYISQVDGQVLPQEANMQACLDRRITGEFPAAGSPPFPLDAQADARVMPEAFRPVETSPGVFPVTFRMIGEGAGFLNILGWYFVDEDVTDPDNLHMVFDCRTGGICSCPCDPTDMRPTNSTPQSWIRTVDFGAFPGIVAGRAIGFFIRTPELIEPIGATTRNNDHCGGPDLGNNNHRTYFTSQALNDDGDFVHFLIYESRAYDDTYYFGFEDLFRGGDNDFEDVLSRVEGLVPVCTPNVETCNGEDDDCDMAVDEGVTLACSSACGAGIRTCSAGTFGSCSAPTPRSETCNNVDDDCDSRTDESVPPQACSNMCGSGTAICRAGAFVDCSAPDPRIEVCNNADDDCDGRTDEMIGRACSTSCGSGTEMCVAGAYVGCTAATPGAETCDNTDEDCDGRTDEGITRPCSTACGSGTEVCISGRYVGCSAGSPGLEACNGLDDDCDGPIDEGLTRTCSTSCGTGTERCEGGMYLGCDAPTPGVEICNNIDDDCDGVIDDGNPGGGDLCVPDGMGGYDVVDEPEPGARCVPGRVRCIAGELTCRGATSPTPEICNCEDDDCDGLIDEDGDGLCPGEGACVECTCLTPCDDTEFPCPPGRSCDRELAVPEREIIGYCVAGMCAGVECTDEEICDPTNGECRNLCEGVTCADGFACVRGGCVEDNCYGRGCPVGERCASGACEPDPCMGVDCVEDAFCRDGSCIEVCSITCPDGEVCDDNVCVPAPCGDACSTGESCVEESCVPDDCMRGCLRGRVCSGTECIDDPCFNVDCPGAATCDGGQCFIEGLAPPPEARLGLAAGGGGCACDAAGGGRESPLGAFAGLLLFFGLAFRRRWLGVPRKRALRASLTGLMMLGAMGSSGCDVEPFCFEDCPDEDAGPVDAGRPDGMMVDGCTPSEETCDGTDEDCDGLVDETFDLDTDPRNCSECGRECILPGAFPGCEAGVCVVDRCEIGFHDLDGLGTNGCEYACLESGDELCDERDNDCDGETDEGFDLTSDLGNCGICGNICAFPNATASCEASACVMGDCNAGFVDANMNPEDGCELACTPMGDEVCNNADDDCDGSIDEGFDLSSDTSNCGSCRNACVFLNAVPACTDGACGIAGCRPGFVDVDGLPTTGCEYECTPAGGADTCNGVDDDCDGTFDEADPSIGSSCGTTTGACTPGTQSCQRGALVCVGGSGPTPETCDGVDEDCDGRTDESTGADPIPGVGARCGTTDTGPCAFGSVVCSGGTLTCGGGVREPTTELCNGIDDNCNGVVDDSPAPGAPPASCALFRGVCAGRTPICMGAGGYECEFPSTYQVNETRCDGLDNDCDGTADEGCLTPRPGSDVRIDTGDASGAANSVQPVVFGDGGSTVYTAWMDLRPIGGADPVAHTYFRRSTNTGDSFLGSPFRLDSAGGAAIGPQFGVVSGSNVNILWADFRGGTGYREIYTRRSTNSGSTFASNTRLNSGMNRDVFNIDVAVSGTNVYAVYEGFTSARNRHIFLLRSADSGATFTGPTRVDHGNDVAVPNFVAATPKVAAVGDDVHVVWRDNRNGRLDVYTVRSTNRGVTLAATDTRLDRGTGASFDPVIAAEGSNVYVAWVDDRSTTSFDIDFARSTNRGLTFATATRIDDDPVFPHDSLEPDIAIPEAGTVVVGWVDYRFGFSDILARTSISAGASFDAVVRLDSGTSAGTSGSFELDLDASGGMVGAAWSDDRSGMLDIYANFSLDGGRTWQPQDYRLDSGTIGTRDSEAPRVYVSGSAVHTVWVDHRVIDNPNADIYYRRLGL